MAEDGAILMHLDRFTSLDDIPTRDWGDARGLLAHLAALGRFSVFDVPLSGPGGRTLTWLLHDSGWIARTWGTYPWTCVELSDAGREVLAVRSGAREWR